MRLAAQDGDAGAARLYLNYTLGRPPEAAEDAIRISLPALTNAGSCRDALTVVMAALAAGEVGVEAAVKLTSVIDAARRAVETVELEERLQDLEGTRTLTPDRRYI